MLIVAFLEKFPLDELHFIDNGTDYFEKLEVLLK